MKKLICLILMLALCIPASANNPIVRYDNDGNLVYTGDPAAFVDGDTVYLYAGHDEGNGYYNMPEWVCYSSKDLINWTYEGVPLRSSDFPWGRDNEAWASQVIKYGDKYYFYMCKNGTGMSVAVSDSPTGPFVDALPGSRLVFTSYTTGKSWGNIDPTVFVETKDGVEHRYLAWGNGNCYIAELNEDMISLVDKNGDGKFDEKNDILNITPKDSGYTEAPWLYERGGVYYLFYACGWHEALGYATADSVTGPYTHRGLIMTPGASSNTNHPAIIDFNGKTYMFYHTGALPAGDGYRRSVCLAELDFNYNGSINMVEESSVGLDGKAVKLSPRGLSASRLTHEHWANSYDAADYPHPMKITLEGDTSYITDSDWEIVTGKTEGENLVSIQSVNKMGYYISEYYGSVYLMHDNDASEETAKRQTFKMIDTGFGYTFESVSKSGYFLCVRDGELVLSKEASFFDFDVEEKCVFDVSPSDSGIVISGVVRPKRRVLAVIKNNSTIRAVFLEPDNDGFVLREVPLSGEYSVTIANRTFTGVAE